MRRRYIWDTDERRLVEVAPDYERPTIKGPAVIGDLEPFQSPIDDSAINGRRQRREHMKRHGLVDYERANAARGRFK